MAHSIFTVYNYVCIIIEYIFFRKDCNMCSVDTVFAYVYIRL